MTTSAKGKAVEEADEGGQAGSKLTNLQDNSVSPNEMTTKKGGKESPLAVSGDDLKQSEAEDAKRAADEDNSIAARLTRTQYVLNENEITGERWIGLSVQRDGNADAATKARTRVTGIAEVRPYKGLTVKPINGEPFAVSDEFDKGSTPADWFAVLNPSTNKPFLEGV